MEDCPMIQSNPEPTKAEKRITALQDRVRKEKKRIEELGSKIRSTKNKNAAH
jgi:chaperonin cofactor prefoldin